MDDARESVSQNPQLRLSLGLFAATDTSPPSPPPPLPLPDLTFCCALPQGPPFDFAASSPGEFLESLRALR